MKKIKYLNKTLFGIMGTLGLGGAVTGGGILAYTNANVDQLDVLTRAVRDNTVEQYKQRAPGDVIVATSDNHSGAIIDNNLYMWGSNNQNQLGFGDTNPRTSPTLVEKISDGTTESALTGTITQIALGGEHSGAVIDGKLYMWGANNAGQLGLGGNWANIPTLVKKVSDAGVESNLTGNISKISFGLHHSGAIIDDKLYTWGRGSEAQLGSGGTHDSNLPTLVENIQVAENAAPTPIIGVVTHISLRQFSSSSVIDGKLYTWGFNLNKQLGIEGATSLLYRPTLVSKFTDGNTESNLTGTISEIGMGFGHCAAIIDNKLYTWGSNGVGQLGISSNAKEAIIPTLVKNTQVGNNAPSLITSNVTQISMGANHSSAVIGGRLYTWGSGGDGQLGLGTPGAVPDKITPTLVENISDGTTESALTGTITQISMGNVYSAVVIDKKVYTWGKNADGQLGLNDIAQRDIPTEVSFLVEKEITLNQTTDPNNIRNDIVYNIQEAKLITLINNLKNEIGIPVNDISYDISPNWKNIGTLDATTTGQIALQIKSSPSNTIIKVKFDGFLPVNLTENVIIPQKNLTIAGITHFANDEINKLVEDAKNDGVNSKLAKWIIDNQLLFIGDTATKYTADFPKDAKITKINNVEVVDGTKGEIRFQIEVDKYYKQATPATDLIESTPTDPALLITSPITLTGFKITAESVPVVKPNSNRNIVSAELLKLFERVDNTTIINGQGLTQLNNYIDLTSFPSNTNFKIIDPKAGDKVLEFIIAADRFFDDKGKLVIPPADKQYPTLTIDMLLDGQSKIEKIPTHPKFPASVILNNIGYDRNNPTNPITGNGLTELKKYVTDLDNFPQQPTTSFTLTNVIENVPGQLSFIVVASNQYNSSGTATGTIYRSPILTFTGLLGTVTTEILVKTNYVKDILSGDLEKAFDIKPNNAFNKVEMEKYVDFNGVQTNATYTFTNYDRTGGTIKFDITPSVTETTGTQDPTPRTFPIEISGLGTILNSSLGRFEKTTITEPGADIATQINTNITNGTTINPNSTTWSLWNKLVDVSIYPPNTEFTIDRITSDLHGGVFTTFEIAVTANAHYLNNQTMTTSETRPPFTIDYLKFNPTSVSKTTQALPDIKANEFLAYINHNDAAGSFDATKLQEFVTFTSFDLSTPGTTTRLVISSNNIIDDKIPLTFEVLNYVDANGDGKNVPTYFTLPTFTLDLKATVLPPVTPGPSDSIGTTDKSTETMILATSIAGGVFLLFLLLLLLLLLIRRKRHMADHYIKISGNNSGNNVNHDSEIDEDDGEYDQFWKDESDWTESSSKKA